MQTSRLAFIDCETTALRPDRRAWEIAVIVRDPGVEDVAYRWFVDIDDLDLGNADPFALKIGRFHERHPEMRSPVEFGDDWAAEEVALWKVEALIRGATVVGIQVDFDTATLDARMRANGICPSWSHRIVDARAVAAGALRLPPPWKPEEIYGSFGVFCPEEDRHTALGDARLARDLYDAVFGRERPAEGAREPGTVSGCACVDGALGAAEVRDED